MPDGGIGIGAVVAGFITENVAIGGIIAGAIDMAIVGAVVGGLTSAVTGGDIMSGVLVGAIGGAVTGGIMGGLNPASFGVGASETATATSVTSLSGDVVTQSADGLVHVTPGVTKQAVSNQIAKEAAKDSLFGISLGDAGGEILAGGVKEAVGGMLSAKSQEEQLAWQAEQAELDRQAKEKLLAMQLDSQESAAADVPKSQQLAATIASITADENQLAKQWHREDTAKARMRAAAKSIGRAGQSVPTLTAREQAVVNEDAEVLADAEYKDPTQSALDAQAAV